MKSLILILLIFSPVFSKDNFFVIDKVRLSCDFVETCDLLKPKFAEFEGRKYNEKELKFDYELNKMKKSYSIPYSQIIDIEYGQKAGRRVGAAVATAILISPVGLFLLFSKKRKHFVTIGYKDNDGKEQVAVFELGKDIIRTTLSILEARSGKKIEYQDEEAKKSSKGN